MRIFLAMLAIIAGSVGAIAGDLSVKDKPGATYDAAPDSSGALFSGFFGGVNLGASAVDLSADFGNGAEFSGFNMDGVRVGGHAGYNFCTGLICFGPELSAGWSDTSLDIGGVKAIELENWARLVGNLEARVNGSTVLGVHAGYEMQFGTVYRGGDFEADWFVAGVHARTYVAPHSVFTLSADYLSLDSIDADRLGASGDNQISRVLEDSDALVIEGRLSYFLN